MGPAMREVLADPALDERMPHGAAA